MSGDALKFLHRSNTSDNFVINKDGSFTLPSTLETSPSTPAAGGVVYVKSDGKLYFKNSSGTEYDMTDTGLDVSTLSDLDAAPASGDFIVIQDITDNSTKKVSVSNLTSTIDADITSVVAGSGLTGGATDGDATLNIGAGTGITVNADDVALDLTGVIASDGANRVLTSDGDGTLTAEANITISSDNLNVGGEIQTAKIAYTDGDDAITIEDDGYIKFHKGNKYSPTVKVNSSYTSGTNRFIKFASAPAGMDRYNTAETTFLLTLAGFEYSTSYDQDATFIISVKYTYYTSSPYYYATGTRVSVEPINGTKLNGFDPSTDLVLTVGQDAADLWIKSKENYKDCFVSIIGGVDNNDPGAWSTGVVDASWVINSGQSWDVSVSSNGTDLAAAWADKTFKDVTAASLDISGDVDIDGTLEADAITVDGTALDTHIAGVTVTNATNATNATTAAKATTVVVSSDYDTNTTQYILFSDAGDGTNGKTVRHDDGLNFNPNKNLLGIGLTDPQAGLHIDVDSGGTTPQLLLDGGGDNGGDIVVPTGEVLQIGHWDNGTTTFTQRLRMTNAGELYAGDFTSSGRTWTDVTFESHWGNYGSVYGDVQYRKDGFGNVHLRGLCKATHNDASYGSSNPIFILPAGYRPNHTIIMYTAASYIDSNRQTTEMRIDSSGNVYLNDSSDNPETNAWVSFDGLYFCVDAD